MRLPQPPSTGVARQTWLTWDNYFVGVLSLATAACFGVSAAVAADYGQQGIAVALGTLAALSAVPAALQILGEIMLYLLLAALVVGSTLLLPALLVSPTARRWTGRQWSRLRT